MNGKRVYLREKKKKRLENQAQSSLGKERQVKKKTAREKYCRKREREKQGSRGCVG